MRLLRILFRYFLIVREKGRTVHSTDTPVPNIVKYCNYAFPHFNELEAYIEDQKTKGWELDNKSDIFNTFIDDAAYCPLVFKLV